VFRPARSSEAEISEGPVVQSGKHRTRSLQDRLESRDHPDEREARLRREEADAEHRRRIEALIIRTILITVSVVSVICLWIVLVPGQSTENAKWATTLLTTIVSGGLGYMTGKNSKPAN
jgi:hypothetical protein